MAHVLPPLIALHPQTGGLGGRDWNVWAREEAQHQMAHQGQWWGTKGSRLSGSSLHYESWSQALCLTVHSLWVLDLAQGLIGRKLLFSEWKHDSWLWKTAVGSQTKLGSNPAPSCAQIQQWDSLKKHGENLTTLPSTFTICGMRLIGAPISRRSSLNCRKKELIHSQPLTKAQKHGHHLKWPS